eukprot:CAMPEP_0113456164 /NCGR_PEP_ID=MMETSP0014_2-20120614/8746_1 /TAXON_ID=2857 /ORGANISM="Nitzschia sp." /LENGTH=93 /DNA_ID=CAMNT_0000347609 /DNA_START=43 /DNA_END=321 /DNA_ORIENTATION=- /assembly_acc=CAM_ASM_000159
MVFSQVARRAATNTTTTVVRRQSTASPKMHKASEEWAKFVAKRPPPSHVEAHKVFHPPFNPAVIGGGIIVVWIIGYGSMTFGYVHQMKKQGFW